MIHALALQAALAAPIPVDSIDEIVLEVRGKHQAPFLIGGTWDTMKPLEKVLAETGVTADLRRVADDLQLASTFLNEAVSSGAYQCALYVGKSSAVTYSLHRFGDCENPPTGGPIAPAPARNTITPDATRTAALHVASVNGAGVDPAAARARLQATLAGRKWPTGDPARYGAAAVVRELACAGAKPSCNALVAWTVTDSERKAVVYQVATRGVGGGADAAAASLAALDNALLSLLSRPLLVSRLDPSPPVAGDPAPDWTGVLPVRACALAGPPLPDGEADLRAHLARATRDDVASPAVFLSPDGWALAPAALAEKGKVTIAVGARSEVATVIRTDRSLGLALYKLPGEDWPCLPAGASALSAGARVYAALDDRLAAASVIGVQAAGSFKFLKTNLPSAATGLSLLDATGQVRAVVSSVVSLGGMAGTPLGLPLPTLIDRLDFVLGPASEPDPAARSGFRGSSAVVPTIDVDDPAPEGG